jgi:hypothetical protein
LLLELNNKGKGGKDVQQTAVVWEEGRRPGVRTGRLVLLLLHRWGMVHSSALWAFSYRQNEVLECYSSKSHKAAKAKLITKERQ